MIDFLLFPEQTHAFYLTAAQQNLLMPKGLGQASCAYAKIRTHTKYL